MNNTLPKSPSRMRAALASLSGVALDLVFPPHCLACGQALGRAGSGAFCAGCASKVNWIGADRCTRCGEAVGQGRGAVPGCAACEAFPPVYVECSAAVAQYREPFRTLIVALKFTGAVQAIPVLGKLLAERLASAGLLEGLNGPWALAPVPLYKRTLGERGFNQAEELARYVAKRVGLPVDAKLLKKVRPTPPQAMLGVVERRENLRDAFSINAKRAAKYKTGGIILIDDVLTTCSTASECARTLHAAGIPRIRMAALARG